MKRKGSSVRIMCLGLILLISLVGFMKPALASQTKFFKWRMQFYKGLSPSYNALLDDWISSVRKMSSGRIEISYYAGGSIVPVQETLSAVSQGTLEMGWSPGAYNIGIIGKFGDVELGLPFSFRTRGENYALWYQKGMLEQARKVYAKRNIYYLSPMFGSGDTLLSKKPIKKLADLKGLKIRSAGITGRVWEKGGGAGLVSMPLTEVFQALEKGIIDGATATPMSFYPSGWTQVAKYMVGPPGDLAIFAHNVLVNMDAWNSLPDELKAIMVGAAKNLNWAYDNLYDKDNAVAVLKAKEEIGMQVVMFPEADIDKLSQMAEGLWDKEIGKDADGLQALKIVKDYMRELKYLK